MNVKKILYPLLLLVLIGQIQSCSTDFEVYAPEQDIAVLYCVLNPADSVQYVRLARAYQVKGDAIEFASANDLSITGEQVKLIGNGKTYTAIEVPNYPKEDGIFFPEHTVYQFSTPPGDDIIAGIQYRIEVGAPDDDFYLFANTVVPHQIRLTDRLALRVGAGTQQCLPFVALDEDFPVRIRTKPSSDAADLAKSFEMRVDFSWEENGVPKTVRFGPTEAFDSNQRCNGSSTEICYEFDQHLLYGFFYNKMTQGDINVDLTYDELPPCADQNQINTLPSSLRFEATAIDQELTRYMTANNPAFTDLTGAKPEYTNLQGNIAAYGIFGSITQAEAFGLLDDCGKWLLNLNGQAKPLSVCELPE